MKTKPMRLVFLALLLMLFSGCGDDGLEIDYAGYDCIQNNPNFDPEPIPAPEGTHQLIFRPNKTVSPIETGTAGGLEVINGRNRVFHYRYRLQTNDTIQRELFFEIAPGIDHFTVSGTSLQDINTYLDLSCSCEDSLQGVYSIEAGCIKGERLDANNWHIDINVNTTQEGQYVELMASATFNKRD